MSDNNTPASAEEVARAVAENNGYIPEPGPGSMQPGSQKKGRPFDSEVKRRNLAATFGHGPGKLALIAVAVIVVVFIVLAISGLRKPPASISSAKVDAPTSPQNRVTTNAVTPQEAARRAEQARLEAEEAQARGKSYQPGFDYNIGGDSKHERPAQTASFSGFDTPQKQSEENSSQSGQGGQAGYGGSGGVAGSTPSSYRSMVPTPQQQAEQQRRDQEMQRVSDRLITEQKTAEAERTKYVDAVSSKVLDQINGMFASQGNDGLNNIGNYSQSTYYSIRKEDAASAAGAVGRAMDAYQRTAGQQVMIKAGSTLYATLDAEANTDDSRTVLATVRSGPWKGSKIIGRIEQAYDNISLNFTTMAPQDSRPTMRVNAVALREADAKLGMAENIDYHTLSRYTALAAAAILQGAGRVYQQPMGTTVVTNGGVVTTTTEPTDRQVIGSAVGELGSNIGAEIRRRGFNQPTTYSTPAETGFILYFLEDVTPTNAIDGQQPAQGQGNTTNRRPGDLSGSLGLGTNVNNVNPFAGMNNTNPFAGMNTGNMNSNGLNPSYPGYNTSPTGNPGYSSNPGHNSNNNNPYPINY